MFCLDTFVSINDACTGYALFFVLLISKLRSIRAVVLEMHDLWHAQVFLSFSILFCNYYLLLIYDII